MHEDKNEVEEFYQVTKVPDCIQEKVTRSKMHVMLVNNFFSTLLCGSTVWYHNSKAYREDTMATDGRDFYFNVDFVKALDGDHLTSILLHEIIHKAMKHVTRRGDRDIDPWNIYCDISVNGILRKGNNPLPENAILADEIVQWEGEDIRLEDLPVEVIYNMMKQNPKQKAGGKTEEQWKAQSPDAMPGDLRPGPATKSDVRRLEAEVNIQNAQALTELKKAGRTSADTPIMKELEKQLEPKVDWKAKLRDFVTSRGKDDWTFAKPNKLYMAHGFYMPSTTGTAVGRLLVAADTSGSIVHYQELVDQFSAEITAICEDVSPESLAVLYMDTEVRRHDEYIEGEEFKLNMTGGGGTAFKSTFDYIAELEIPPVAVIVFTDMEVYDLEECQCDIPTLWIQYGHGNKVYTQPPFGVVTPIS